MKQIIKIMVGFVLLFTSASVAERKLVPIVMDDMIFFASHSTFSSVNNLEVPTFNGNSQGKLVVQCENDIVYYIMAYDCLRWDTKTSATASIGDIVVDDEQHIGEVFYTVGHVERTGPVTITGKVYTGGKTLSYDWIQTCP